MSDNNKGSHPKRIQNTFFRLPEPFPDIKPDRPKSLKWGNPLPDTDFLTIPVGKMQQGAFGSKKQHQYCSGIEISCFVNEKVCAVEDGKVVKVFDYSKQQNTWTNKTRVVMIEGLSGVICYCNLQEEPYVIEGTEIKKGTYIGHTVPIYKDKKTTKIRIELYERGVRNRINWYFTKPKPKKLLDPTQHLLSIIAYRSR